MDRFTSERIQRFVRMVDRVYVRDGRLPITYGAFSLHNGENFGGGVHPASRNHKNSFDLQVPRGEDGQYDYKATWPWIQAVIDTAGRRDSPVRLNAIYLDHQETIDQFSGWVTPGVPLHFRVIHFQFEPRGQEESL